MNKQNKIVAAAGSAKLSPHGRKLTSQEDNQLRLQLDADKRILEGVMARMRSCQTTEEDIASVYDWFCSSWIYRYRAITRADGARHHSRAVRNFKGRSHYPGDERLREVLRTKKGRKVQAAALNISLSSLGRRIRKLQPED